MAVMLRRRRPSGQPQTGPAADAPDGYRGAGAEAAHHKTRAGPQDLSLSAARPAIERPNHVWAADITYIPMGRGFLYLVAIIDWASRAVLAWRLSNTMDRASAWRRSRRRWRASASPRSSTPTKARSSPARPSPASAGRRHPHLDGRARPLDGQCVHRAGVALAQIRGRLSQGLCRRPRGPARHRRMDRFYNLRRPHQALGYRTPMAVWRVGLIGRYERPWI